LVCPDPSQQPYDAAQDGGGGAGGKRQRYVLTGLVSWGIGCANTWPGVYVNVPHFLPWVRDLVDKYDPGFDPYA
jgi:secreted trypsin-like serine protease